MIVRNDILKYVSWTGLFVFLSKSIYGEPEAENELSDNSSAFNKSLFFQNGLYHKLPKVTLESKFIVSNNNTVWILDIPENTTGEYSNDHVIITASATFPFHAFIQYPDTFETNMWGSTRDAENLLNVISFKFEIVWYLHWSFLKAKNNSIEFRSIVPPFFGVSVLYTLSSQNGIAVFERKTSIADTFKDYFGMMNTNTRSKSCSAYFVYEKGKSLNSKLSQSKYSCFLANRSPGFIVKNTNYYEDMVFLNFVRYEKNCWMTRESCEKHNLCKSQNHHILQLLNEGSSYLTCNSRKLVSDNHKDMAVATIFEGLSDYGQQRFPEIYFAKEDIEPSSMILIEPFEKYHNVGTNLEVKCRFARSFASHFARFGVKYKDSDHINIFGSNFVFKQLTQMPTSGRANTNIAFAWDVSEYNIELNNTDIENIFCFAPVRGSYDWINASKQISVVEFSRPKFIIKGKQTATLEDNILITECAFTIGSKNQSISCEAVGFPPPRISWTHNNIVLKSRKSLDTESPNQQSVIVFKEVYKKTEGLYICKAENSQGEVKLFYNVVVTDNSTTILAVSITTGAAVVFILILLCFALFVWRRLKQHHIPVTFLSEQELTEFVNGSQKRNNGFPNTSIMRQAFDEKYILPRTNLSCDFHRILGSGQFGVVINGWLYMDGSTPTQIAIKTTKQNIDLQRYKALLSEIKISSFLNGHPNVITFMGACIENIKNGEIYAAYEFCQQGDLLTVLRRRKAHMYPSDRERAETLREANKTMSCNEHLFEWSRDIANGMTFLSIKNVIHGDLAARNVLIAKNNVAKISDFGLSRQLLNDYSIYVKKTKAPLPWKWMAPECLEEASYSLQSDVWSFGVTIWEIFSLGDPPYPGQRYGAQFIKDIREGIRPHKPQFAAKWIYKIMLRCWEKEPDARPRIFSVATEIQEFIDNVEKESATNHAMV